MINKIKSTKTKEELISRNHTFLSLILFLTLITNTCCLPINGSNKTIGSSPQIVLLQTYRDWSSRLGSNQTTPQSSALVFEESKLVKTTDYAPNPMPSTVSLMTSTEKTINELKESVTTAPKTENSSTTTEQVNAHNIAAQVLSRILYINPLLALASNGVPYRRLNYTSRSSTPDKLKNLPPIETLNEIEVDSDINHFKPERMSASGISFPSTLPTTTDILMTEATTEPTAHNEQPSNPEEEHEHHDNEHEHEDDEPAASEPTEESDEYEDDDEMESFRHPVRVTFQDTDYDNNERENDRDESHPPFVMPNLNLNPESLKQKGCRTVVKEVQAVPALKGNSIQNQSPQNPKVMSRIKRSSDDNSRKFTSIVMTKECHFPDDGEGASSEETPQTIANTASKDLQRVMSPFDVQFQSTVPSPPSYDDYDEDFDFRAKYPYPSKNDLIDRMETKSSNDRKSYADSPLFRRDNSDNSDNPEDSDDFSFDDPSFDDFSESKRLTNNKNNKNKANKKRPKVQKKSKQMSSSPIGSYDFDDEDFGPQPKKKSKSKQQKRPPVYQSEGREGGKRGGGGGSGRAKDGRRKPKKINRSFAFFRKAEPKDKDPNESDYSVSYGRGNFQSFSEDYDSDRDGPRRKGGPKGKSGKIRYRSKGSS